MEKSPFFFFTTSRTVGFHPENLEKLDLGNTDGVTGTKKTDFAAGCCIP